LIEKKACIFQPKRLRGSLTKLIEKQPSASVNPVINQACKLSSTNPGLRPLGSEIVKNLPTEEGSTLLFCVRETDEE